MCTTQTRDVLLMSVRTLAISVMILDLTLPSGPGAWPKAGSYEDGERLTRAEGQEWLACVFVCLSFFPPPFLPSRRGERRGG